MEKIIWFIFIATLIFDFAVQPTWSIEALLGLNLAGASPERCPLNEEFRSCGPNCELTCDKLEATVCCDQKCRAGCYCQDGFIRTTNSTRSRCIPLAQCMQPGVFEFETETLEVTENAGSIEILVVRREGSHGTVRVQWATRDGTAVQVEDYQAASGELHFKHNEMQQSIKINILDDLKREDDEFFFIDLTSVTQRMATLGLKRTIRIIIKANDRNPGTVGFVRHDYLFPENAGLVLIPVIRTGGTDGDIAVHWRTVDNSATTGVDYESRDDVLHFSDGQIQLDIEIEIINDRIREINETFDIELYAPLNGAVLGQRRITTITILDDDEDSGIFELEMESTEVTENSGLIEIIIVRTVGSHGTVAVKWMARDGTARLGEDYRPSEGEVIFEDGQIRGSIRIEIIDDSIREDDEFFFVDLIDVTQRVTTLGIKKTIRIIIKANDRNHGSIGFQSSIVQVSERGVARLFVLRSGGEDGMITVRWETRDNTALRGIDYGGDPSGVLDFYSGETMKVLTIPIIDDNIKKMNKAFTVVLSEPTGGATIDVNVRVTVIIIDDDKNAGVFGFEYSQMEVIEDHGTVQIPVIRTEGFDGTVAVKYRTVDRTAKDGIDYIGEEGEITFADGVARMNIDISIIDDSIRDGDKQFVVELQDVTRRSVSFGRLTTIIITIKDNDNKPGSVTFQRPLFSFLESAGRVQIPVIRTEGTDGNISVRWRTVDNTATKGEDYESRDGVLYFSDGQIEANIEIEIINDLIRERNKTFDIELYDPTDGAVVSPLRVTTVTIIDDDANYGRIQFETANVTVIESLTFVRLLVRRIDGTDGDVTVTWTTTDGTALLGQDYDGRSGLLTFPDGVSSQEIRIHIINDDLKEPEEPFTARLMPPQGGAVLGSNRVATVTIIDDDRKEGVFEFELAQMEASEGIGTVRIVIVRSDGTDGNVIVRWKTVEGTAKAGLDYVEKEEEIAFPDGVQRMTISVEIIDDSEREEDKQFVVELISATVRSVTLGRVTRITITIKDNDGQPGMVQFRRRAYFFPESVGKILIPVMRLVGTDGLISVNWKTVDGTATSGLDYVDRSGELFFRDGEKEKNVEIEIVNDNLSEKNETFEIQLFNPTDGAVIGPLGSTTITILNDDDHPKSVVQFKRRSGRVKESAGIVKIPVTLNRRGGPPSEVTVKWKTIDRTAVHGEDFIGGSGVLKFGSLQSENGIEIQIINERVNEENEMFDVMIFDPSDNAEIGSPDVCTVTIMDDDDGEPGIIKFENSGGTIGEPDGEIEIKVAREGGTDGTVSVKWDIVDMTATFGTEYGGPVTGTLIFGDGEHSKIIRVTIVDDTVPESEKKFKVELSYPTGGATLGEPKTFIVTIIDNDQTYNCESNQIWLACVSCQKTCQNPVCMASASAPCNPGCGCPDHLYLDQQLKKCVPMSECPPRRVPIVRRY